MTTTSAAAAAVSEDDCGAECGVAEMLAHALATELRRPGATDALSLALRPLLRWFAWNLLPYGLCLLGAQFFVTLAALALVSLVAARRQNIVAA